MGWGRERRFHKEGKCMTGYSQRSRDKIIELVGRKETMQDSIKVLRIPEINPIQMIFFSLKRIA